MPSDDLTELHEQALAALAEARAEVAVAEAAVREARLRLTTARATLAGAEASEAALRAGIIELADVDVPEDLPVTAAEIAAASRTAAITAVLAQADGSPLGIAEVIDALQRTGRDDGYQVVVSTLRHLVRAERIANPTRGRYCSI